MHFCICKFTKEEDNMSRKYNTISKGFKWRIDQSNNEKQKDEVFYVI